MLGAGSGGAVGGRLGFSLKELARMFETFLQARGGGRRTGAGTGNRRADVSEGKDR